MKPRGRILAILLVVTAIAGMVYFFGQAAQANQPSDFRGESDDDMAPGERPNFGSESGDRDRDRQSWDSDIAPLTEFARMMLPLLLLMTAVVLLAFLGQTLRRRAKKRQPPAGTTTPDA